MVCRLPGVPCIPGIPGFLYPFFSLLFPSFPFNFLVTLFSLKVLPSWDSWDYPVSEHLLGGIYLGLLWDQRDRST